MFGKKRKPTVKKKTALYDEENEYPCIRASICTGEKVAGFRNRHNGRFTDVMLIRSKSDENKFIEMYSLDVEKLDVEY